MRSAILAITGGIALAWAVPAPAGDDPLTALLGCSAGAQA